MAEKEKPILVGSARCPITGCDGAQVKCSPKSKLSYLVCSACHVQIFSRGDRSDAALRGLVKAAPVVEVPAVEEKKPAPAKPEKAVDSWQVW